MPHREGSLYLFAEIQQKAEQKLRLTHTSYPINSQTLMLGTRIASVLKGSQLLSPLRSRKLG